MITSGIAQLRICFCVQIIGFKSWSRPVQNCPGLGASVKNRFLIMELSFLSNQTKPFILTLNQDTAFHLNQTKPFILKFNPDKPFF